jgi:hypothetical protein
MKEEIANLTFKELCDRIRHDYNDSLPESAYESIESLVNALKDTTKEDQPMYKYASGYAYHGNVLKALFFDAAFRYPSLKFTLRDICEFGNLPLYKVRVMVSKWNRRGYPYLTKLKKRTAMHENVYKLRKYAYSSYFQYKKRLSLGFDLNLQRPQPKKVEIYVSINDRGRRMGLTSDALPDIPLAHKT